MDKCWMKNGAVKCNDGLMCQKRTWAIERCDKVGFLKIPCRDRGKTAVNQTYLQHFATCIQ